MSNAKNHKNKKVYKSLYEVKDRFLPNASLDYLESKDNEFTRDALMQMIKKVTHPVQTQSAQKKS